MPVTACDDFQDLEELSLPFQSRQKAALAGFQFLAASLCRPSEAHMQEVLPVSLPASFKVLQVPVLYQDALHSSFAQPGFLFWPF